MEFHSKTVLLGIGLIGFAVGVAEFTLEKIKEVVHLGSFATMVLLLDGIIFEIFFSISLSWICDCYMKKYYAAVVSLIELVVSLFFFALTFFISFPFFRRFFYFLAVIVYALFKSSMGILNAVFLEQLDITELPEKGGFLRKYVFFYTLFWFFGMGICRSLRPFFENLIFYGVVSVLSAGSIIVFFLLFTRDDPPAYKAPYKLNMLLICIQCLLKKNVNLWNEDLDEDEKSTYKLISVSIPLVWVVFACLMSDLAEVSFAKSVLGAKFSYIQILMLLLVWLVLMPLTELFFIPLFCRKKTSIHLMILGLLLISIALSSAGFHKMHLETVEVTAPTEGHGQLRFYSATDKKINITIDDVTVSLFPYESAFFLGISAVKNVIKNIKIKSNDLSREYSVTVVEKASYSFIVDDKNLKHIKFEDPLDDLVVFDDMMSHFYVLPLCVEFDVNFMSEDKLVNIAAPGVLQSSSSDLILVVSGQKLNMVLSRSHVYCLHCVFHGGDYTGYLNASFFHVTNIPKKNTAVIVAEMTSILWGEAILIVSYMHFIHTESPVYLRATTFTFGEFMISATHRIYLYAIAGPKMTGVQFLMLALALLSITVLSLSYALNFEFSEDCYK